MVLNDIGFKPYYKWITFNTSVHPFEHIDNYGSFKPYYKWITFNTELKESPLEMTYKRFKPYYKWITFNTFYDRWNQIFC